MKRPLRSDGRHRRRERLRYNGAQTLVVPASPRAMVPTLHTRYAARGCLAPKPPHLNDVPNQRHS